jgi:phosphoribosyl-dephospho-CoA transferase
MRPESRTHALLRIAGGRALASDGGLPVWAGAALERAPWVVVRRARGRDGLIPVGVRGSRRGERLAAWLHADAVLECVTPPQLAARGGWHGSARCVQVPALAVLATVAELLRGWELSWGPGGSVGFELASGVPTATVASDLDLVIGMGAPLASAAAARLWASLARLPVRVEALLETPHGAVALEEYAAGRLPLLLRTPDGPRLVDDPWAGAAAAA